VHALSVVPRFPWLPSGAPLPAIVRTGPACLDSVTLDEETGRDRYFAQRERELAALVDPATGLVAERYAEIVDCPGCGRRDWDELFVKGGFTFVRCVECEQVFSNPQVREELVEDEYRSGGSNDIWVDVLLSERQLALDRAKFGELLDELEPYRGEGRILDVGCSIGLFLHLAEERGWRTQGTEFSEKALRYAREEFGLDVVDTPLEESGWADETFDVITLNSVIEHVNEPRRLFAEIRRLLKPRGALYVITPNVDSLACRVLHERAATFDGRNHLVYFSSRTLTRMLESSGFVVDHCATRVSSLQPILEWLAYRTPYENRSLAGDALSDWLDEGTRRSELEATLIESGLGYKLHCLATRT
jgi:2-polyprenyl-3-methyl-5-hydroxy-6-metoxy-1,4-benzoquinol methylase